MKLELNYETKKTKTKNSFLRIIIIFEILDPDCYERPRHKPPFPSDNAPTSNR